MIINIYALFVLALKEILTKILRKFENKKSLEKIKRKFENNNKIFFFALPPPSLFC